MTTSTLDKRLEEIRALARDHAEDSIQTLADVQNDDEAPAAARVVAANSLLNRGFGMPERRVEQKVDVTIYDQRTAHLQALKQLAEDNPTVEIIEDAEYTTIPAPKAQTEDRPSMKTIKDRVRKLTHEKAPSCKPEPAADPNDWG